MPAEEIADEEIEAEDNENRANAEEEMNDNNEGEEIQDEEIEENREAKEKDNDKVSPFSWKEFGAF